MKQKPQYARQMFKVQSSQTSLGAFKLHEKKKRLFQRKYFQVKISPQSYIILQVFMLETAKTKTFRSAKFVIYGYLRKYVIKRHL